MSIRTKLVLSFTAIMVLFAGNVVVYLVSDSQRRETLDGVLDAIARQKLITSVSRGINGKVQEMALLNTVMGDTGQSQASGEQIEEFEAELEGIGRDIRALLERSTPEDLERTETLVEVFDQVREAWTVSYRNLGVDPTKAIMALAMDAEPVTPAMQRIVSELRDRQDAQVDAASLRFAQLQDTTRRLTIGILAISLVLAIAIAGWMSRSVTRSVTELREGADRLGSGQLDARIEIHSEDEFGRLATRFNDMAEKLEAGRASLQATSEELRRQRDRERAQAQRLAEAMSRVEQGDFHQRLPVAGNDVWTGLYRGFNLMTEGVRDEARILKVAQDLSGELKIDTLIEKIMLATTQLQDADRSSLFLWDRKTDDLWSRFAQGLEIREIRFPSSRGIAGSVFRSGEPLNISDPYSHPEFNPETDRKTGYKTESILCMPITGKNGVPIGVTQVLNKRGGAFTERDEARLRGLTSQVAVSLENAQLFAEVTNVKNYNESILQSSSNGLITLDTERTVVTANDAALKILNGGRDSLLGRPASEYFQGANGWVLESIATVEQTGETDISVDADLQMAEGETASVNLTVVPLIDVAEKPIGTLLMIEDMTGEKRVKTTMARYMSKQVVDQLLAAGEGHLEGDAKRVSILFADVRNFTNMAEAMGARETVALLNEYFEVMVDIIFQFGGILDKYIGDAIMALFGAPFEGAEDADHAVAAATKMLEALHRLNRTFQERGREPLRIGIGIGTDEVIAGSIGSSKRMEYTVIGDSVNLASRLEAANKFYGTGILLSEQTVADLKGDHVLREIDLIRVKGKDRPVAVFEALGYHTEESFPQLKKTLRAFAEGLRRYRAREWDRAASHFERALEAHPGDTPSSLYLDRCRQYAVDPPPSDWKGVWTMATK